MERASHAVNKMQQIPITIIGMGEIAGQQCGQQLANAIYFWIILEVCRICRNGKSSSGLPKCKCLKHFIISGSSECMARFLLYGPIFRFRPLEMRYVYFDNR